MTSPSLQPLGTRSLAQRVNELDSRIGRQIAELREEAGVTRAELAQCAGTTRSYLWKIERGEAQPTLEMLIAIGHCLGADLGVRYFPGTGPRIHDRFQAPMIEALIRELGPEWRAQPEVPVPAARGVLDLVLRRPHEGLVVACECHSELRRLEAVVRRLAEKAEGLAGQLGLAVAGMPPAGESETAVSPTVSRLLLLRSTAATRSIARAYEATLAAAFPARTAEAVAALRGGGAWGGGARGDAAWPGPAIVWARLEGGKAEILEAPPRGVRIGR